MSSLWLTLEARRLFNQPSIAKLFFFLIAVSCYGISGFLFWLLGLGTQGAVSLLPLLSLIQLLIGLWYGLYYFGLPKPNGLRLMSRHNWAWLGVTRLIGYSLLIGLVTAAPFIWAVQSLSGSFWLAVTAVIAALATAVGAALAGAALAVLARAVSRSALIRFLLLLVVLAILALFADPVLSTIKTVETALFSSASVLNLTGLLVSIGFLAVTAVGLELCVAASPKVAGKAFSYGRSYHGQLLFQTNGRFWPVVGYFFNSFLRDHRTHRRLLAALLLLLPLLILGRAVVSSNLGGYLAVPLFTALVLAYLLAQTAERLATELRGVNPLLTERIWGAIGLSFFVALAVILLLVGYGLWLTPVAVLLTIISSWFFWGVLLLARAWRINGWGVAFAIAIGGYTLTLAATVSLWALVVGYAALVFIVALLGYWRLRV